MDKIEEARKILNLVGMPKTQQTDHCCYALLAIAGINISMGNRNVDCRITRAYDTFKWR